MTGKRRAKEREAGQRPRPEAADEVWEKMRGLLDDEVQRLPEKYRAPLVLCDLEGMTRKDAARHLGWPEGTVAGRLARARLLLAKRFRQQGLVLSGAALGAVLSVRTAAAGFPPPSLLAPVKAALRYGPGQASAAGTVSHRVAALAKGVLMFAAHSTGTLFMPSYQRPANGQPSGVEIAFYTNDVAAAFAKAVAEGAAVVAEPKTMSWGQTVAYVRAIEGTFIGICTPMGE
jgi:uncharacterized glyoxalase superfamily protein PhnB